MAESGSRGLTWVAEMPVPAGNVWIHFQSYVLEQWLRRIALAALMAKGGAAWPQSMPEGLLTKAKQQVGVLSRLAFIDPEKSDNLIWSLTVEQLREVLTTEKLSPFVFELTGLARRDLDRELLVFREIRNTVAHHRATNEVTFENFRLVNERLGKAIDHFKRRVLYRGIVDPAPPPAEALFEPFFSSGLSEGRSYVLSDHDPFYELAFLNGDPELEGGFVDVGNLLDLFDRVRHLVLCVLLPHAQGFGEVSVVWPKDLSPVDLEAVRDASLLIRQETGIPYDQQDPKHICNPLIWFERGRSGATAAGVPQPDGRFIDEIFPESSSDE